MSGRTSGTRACNATPLSAPLTGTGISSSTALTGRALQELGCRFALVQLVELPERAGSWGHLLDAAGLEEALRSIEEIEVSETPLGEDCLAEARFYGGERLFVGAREEGLVSAVRALWALRTVYSEVGVVRRVDPGGSDEIAVGEAVSSTGASHR